MTGAFESWWGPAAVVACAALISRFRPVWILPLLLVLLPLRIEVFPSAHLSTLALMGAAAGRAERIARILATERALVLGTLALPAWIALSALWARQPWFVWSSLGSWLGLTLAAWLAAADESDDPRPLVCGALLAVTPHALWSLAERMRLIAPIGAPRELELRLIVMGDLVRGKALFWHPNRLAEFTEQVGLLLAGAGAGGVLPWLSAAGVVVCMVGVWSTGSTAGMATIFGGTVLVLAWMMLPRVARAVAPWIAGIAAVGAAVIAWQAFVAHQGIGSRWMVYRFAGELIAESPWLGVGAGNWSLAVAGAPTRVSQFWFRGHSHSLPLQLWVELGLVGVALGTLFFALPIWSAARRLRSGSPWYGIGVGASFAALGLFAHNLVHYFLREPSYGLITGMMLGLAISSARKG